MLWIKLIGLFFMGEGVANLVYWYLYGIGIADNDYWQLGRLLRFMLGLALVILG
jgi:hypothetical protein